MEMEKLGGSPMQPPAFPEGGKDTSKKGLKFPGENIDHKIAYLKDELSASKGSSGSSRINWFVNKIGIGSLGREIVSSKLEKAHVKLLNATGRPPIPPPRDDKFPTSAVKTAQMLNKKQQEKSVVHAIIAGMKGMQKNSSADYKMQSGILAEIEGEIDALKKHLESFENLPPPPLVPER